ncbi:MAG: hypothetical protein KAT17_06100 [Candidatus Aminicenantes bacterium]|nr:hypothetical protein [Candidatus Aminicenantes bacterium]
MIKRMLFWLFVFVIFVFFMTGCMNLSIQRNVDYPESLFKQKLKRIESLRVRSQREMDQASRLNFLVYDGDDRELISFSVLTDIVLSSLDGIDCRDHAKVSKYSEEYLTLKWKHLKNLDRLGPGLIAEIEDLKENSHILIWLD